jgi:iron complex transport system substrate-binding protein
MHTPLILTFRALSGCLIALACIALVPSRTSAQDTVGVTNIETTPPVSTIPQRIVSLDLCTDWMLALHVEPARIAALSVMQGKPRWHAAPWMQHQSWPSHDNSLEAITRLHPDLVLSSQYNNIMLRERLQQLGLRVEVLPHPQTPADLQAYERRFLTLAGLPAARASRIPAPRPAGRQRLLLMGANGIGTGIGTFEDALIKIAGWQNYLPEPGIVRLDMEAIALNPPDAVLWTPLGGNAVANAFAEHPVWQRLDPQPAWLSTDYWRWQCPGTWMWGLIDELASLLEKTAIRTP